MPPTNGSGTWLTTPPGRRLSMKVEEIMSVDLETCRLEDTLNRPAQIMWEHDCGVVPVVDGEARVVGIITDRDICIAAYTQGRPLSEIPVSSACSQNVR